MTPKTDPRRPAAGTKLTRVYALKTYEVEVLADGFLFDGRTYTSLSKVASEITNSSRNGYEFFKLGDGPARIFADGTTPRPAPPAGKDYSAMIGSWLTTAPPEAAALPVVTLPGITVVIRAPKEAPAKTKKTKKAPKAKAKPAKIARPAKAAKAPKAGEKAKGKAA